ncbi:MAG TPA: macro domain-containing protein, partial [Chloroflexia bacterium]|nr:macro domain-containing protein [Chloroflexia bacterium]
MIQIVLCDLNIVVVRAWEKFCGDLDFVSIRRGSILDVTCDAVVSPANSFGFMDGGVDAVYLNYFGAALEARVQRTILTHHAGELVVGNADIVETGNSKIPFLIIAPTMRVPMLLRESVNAYLAARAVFLLVQQGRFAAGSYRDEPVASRVKTIALPGFGTGVGQMGPNTSAHQMRQAIDDVILGEYTFPQSWVAASQRH